MLLKNLSTADGLVNGARGVIIRWVEGRDEMRAKRRKCYEMREKRKDEVRLGEVR